MRSVTWDGRVRITREPMYRIEELSPTIQERAWMVWMETQEYPWSEENRRSLEEFSDLFGISVRDWRYGGGRRHISYRVPEWDLYRLQGVRLWKYLAKHYTPDIEQTCPLTGYYMDDVLLDPIRRFLRRPNAHTTMEDLVHDAMWDWVYACDQDYEWYFSFEHFQEYAEANSMVFTSDGSDWDYMG